MIRACIVDNGELDDHEAMFCCTREQFARISKMMDLTNMTVVVPKIATTTSTNVSGIPKQKLEALAETELTWREIGAALQTYWSGPYSGPDVFWTPPDELEVSLPPELLEDEYFFWLWSDWIVFLCRGMQFGTVVLS